MFGEAVYKYLIVVFTKVDTLQEYRNLKDKFENYLQKTCLNRWKIFCKYRTAKLIKKSIVEKNIRISAEILDNQNFRKNLPKKIHGDAVFENFKLMDREEDKECDLTLSEEEYIDQPRLLDTHKAKCVPQNCSKENSARRRTNNRKKNIRGFCFIFLQG